jgi:hypothetical protein
MVHIEPWNEAGHRLLIGALESSGQRGEATRQYRRCRETLKRELGIEPDPETEELAARLFAANQSPDPLAGKPIEMVEPQDEVLLRRAMKMLDEAREEIRDNLDHSASLMDALRLDRKVLDKLLVRLERIIDTKHVGMKSLEAMRDVIKQRLGDEHLAPAPRPRPQSNGEVGAELRA